MYMFTFSASIMNLSASSSALFRSYLLKSDSIFVIKSSRLYICIDFSEIKKSHWVERSVHESIGCMRPLYHITIEYIVFTVFGCKNWLIDKQNNSRSDVLQKLSSIDPNSQLFWFNTNSYVWVFLFGHRRSKIVRFSRHIHRRCLWSSHGGSHRWETMRNRQRHSDDKQQERRVTVNCWHFFELLTSW